MVTQAFLDDARLAQKREVYLVLITIDHAELAAPYRFVNNTASISSRGNVFEAFPFRFAGPEEREAAPLQARVTIDVVNGEMIAVIRALSGKPSLVVEVILASDPDTVQRTFPTLYVQNARWSGAAMDLTVGPNLDTDEPLCGWVFNPQRAPALF